MIKKTALLTVLGSVMALNAVQAQNITIENVISICAGVMDGIVQADHIDYIRHCIGDSEQLVTDVENAVTDFSSGSFWGITAGMLDVKQFIADFTPEIADCGNIPEDFNRLGEFFSIFGNTTLLIQRVTYNALWYYSNIITDYNQAMAFWAQGDFFNFGEKIGEALVEACGDHTPELPLQIPTAAPVFKFNKASLFKPIV